MNLKSRKDFLNESLDKLFSYDQPQGKLSKHSYQNSDNINYGKFMQDESNDVFDIFNKNDKIFTFVEINPRFEEPLVYKYSIEKGNLSRGSSSVWAPAEIRSGSLAFHKNKPERMAIPNDLNLAIKIAIENRNNYNPR